MLKSCMKRLTAVILALTLAITLPLHVGANNYEKLTYDEADAWLHSITYEEVVGLVIDYDYIEHSIPVIITPPMTYIIVDRDLHINPLNGQKLFISIGGVLSYAVTIEPEIIENFIPEPVKPETILWPYVAIGVGSFVLGIGLTAILVNAIK